MKPQNFKTTLIILLEVVLIALLFLLIFPFSKINAGLGQNVTVATYLEIGKSAPTIKNINIHDGSVVLIPNSTRTVNCTVEIEDFDTSADIVNVTAEFFDSSVSYYGDSDAGNYHYTNSSCYIDTDYDPPYAVLAHCLFEVVYYANAGEWNCTAYVEDSSAYFDEKSNTTQVEELFAIWLLDQINYGTVNSTYVSDEQIANVTNFGNVMINLSLSGYARTEGDDLAMNCTLGSVGEISVEHEKYNLTASTAGDLSFSDFENLYTNLTSIPTIRRFELDYKKDDTPTPSLNQTYWRIYVPTGVAGTCQGNILFGAIRGEE